jgi:hypothetical protein
MGVGFNSFMYSLGRLTAAVKNPASGPPPRAPATKALPAPRDAPLPARLEPPVPPREKWKWIGAAVGGVLGGAMLGAVSLPLFGFLAIPGFIFGVHYGGKVGSGFDAVERMHAEFATDAVAPSRHAGAFASAMIVACTGFGGLAGAMVLGAVSLPLFGILAVPGLLFGMAIGAMIGRLLFR